MDILDEVQFKDLRLCVSLCLKNLLLPHSLRPVPEDDARDQMFHPTHANKNVPRDQRILTNLKKFEDSRSVSVEVGRVLDPATSLMDRNLARLSSEAPSARIKWQNGSFISRGSSGTVRTLFYQACMAQFNSMDRFTLRPTLTSPLTWQSRKSFLKIRTKLIASD